MAVPVILVAGIWAVATIHFQTELLPLFPQNLPSVRGVALLQSAFTSAQDVTVVLTNPVGTLDADLRKLPEVEAATVLGGRQLDSAVRSIGWMIANLPPEKFAEFQRLFAPAELDARLDAARENLTGAVDLSQAAMLQFDPLGILPWLREAGVSLPGTESTNHFVVIVVHARHELRTFEQCQRFVDAVRGVVGGNGLITGRPAFMAENSRTMRRDMLRMVLVAGALVALVFWLAYRSFAALLWMLPLQALSILAGVIAARLVFGELNVLSIGFAAILLGLGIDYCIVVYHHFATGEGNWQRLRFAVWMSAATTVAAFAALHFASFPGLNQLATLVSAGLLTMAFLATTLLPVALRRRPQKAPAWLDAASERWGGWVAGHQSWILGLVVVAVCLLPVMRHYRFYDADLNRLRPPGSEAYRALDLLQQMRGDPTGQDVIVRGDTEAELAANAEKVLPGVALRPRDEFLEANRSRWKSGSEESLRAALERAGFDESWGRATTRLLETLDAWDFREERLFLSNVSGNLALLRVPAGYALESLPPGTLPASWPLMTADLKRTIAEDFRKLSVLIVAAVLLLCWWAHRSWRQVLWHALALAIALAGLFALLFVTRESMTLMSLLALPLVTGLAVDYGLHVLLALEEDRGDVRHALRQLAAPLSLMALTSLIGFGAPVLTQQPILQNFGLVMALGIVSAAVTGLLVLPALYGAFHQRPHYSQILYRAFWFELGAKLRPSRATGRFFGRLYGLTHPHRRRVVEKNLALIGAKADALDVFANFGQTLADYFVLRPEMIAENLGSEHLLKLAGDGHGAVLVTAHLGLFELGSFLMPKIGQHAIVLSAPEPSPALGAWRAKFRQRWGAETFEVGNDNFSFVEITRRLAKGRCVAMLIDRPGGGNFVDLGGIPFSTGPVWLSLLSGAPLIAVTVVARPEGGYRVQAHPPIWTKWLPAGRDETVRHYTKEVAGIFLNAICKHPDQWYQFVDLSAR
jgi:predicted RND superfamily exporter protein/lauroyl/myristoyl acyltransferase